MAAENDKSMDVLDSVFLEFGKAVYICQCFEESLCFLLSQMARDQAQGDDGAFVASWDFHSRKTLGQLLRFLQDRIELPDNLEEYLTEGVEIRNRIIHGFVTKNARRLYDPKDRLEVEREIKQLKMEVKRRDAIVNRLLDALWKKYSLSNELLKRDADQLWDYLNPDAPSDASCSH